MLPKTHKECGIEKLSAQKGHSMGKRKTRANNPKFARIDYPEKWRNPGHGWIVICTERHAPERWEAFFWPSEQEPRGVLQSFPGIEEVADRSE